MKKIFLGKTIYLPLTLHGQADKNKYLKKYHRQLCYKNLETLPLNIVALRVYFGFGNGLLEGELKVTCTLKPCFSLLHCAALHCTAL